MNDAAFEKHCRWYEKNLKIVTKQGKLEPFVLNPIQKVLERAKAESFERKEPFLAIVLKARQEGVSTWAEGSFFRDGRDFDNRSMMVVAHKEDSTRRIFEMSRRFHKHFPTKIETEKASARTLLFADTLSEFSVQTAGSEEGAARSFTCLGLHVSELDYCPDAMALLGAAMQTIPDTYPAVIILESTASGPGGAMELLWNRAIEGKTAFVPFFFPWFDDPTYRLPITLQSIKKYAPDDWKRQNRKWIEAVRRREEADGLGRQRSADTERGGGRGEEIGDAGVLGAEGATGRDQQSPVHEGADGGAGAPRGGHLHGLPEDRREASERTDPVLGESDQAGGRVFREVRAGGGDEASLDGGRSGFDDRLSRRVFGVEDLFKDSLTPYEMQLIVEFSLSYEQINWLRYCLETKCSGDESVRKREYPSRPEEAFEAATGAVLDQAVLARWMKAAEASVPTRGSMKLTTDPSKPVEAAFDDTDRFGKIEIYEPPRYGRRYVLGLDSSHGIQGGDWTVGAVLDVDSGVQAAEYRAVIDPDLATDQIEALAFWYNRAEVAVETTGGAGMPYLRHLLDRKIVPVYERLAFDKIERVLVKRPGWSTDVKTRPLLVAAMREAVRKETIHVKSKTTISECRTLHEKKTGEVGIGKIEARPGCHDDGFFAIGIAQMVRNDKLRNTRKTEEQKRNERPWMRRFNRIAKIKDNALSLSTMSPKHVRPGAPKAEDGARSRL